MVLLVEKFGRAFRFPSRLDHHHHNHNQPSHDDEALLASSLRAFRSEVSKILNQILNEKKPGLEFVSLAWCDKCFEAIPMIHRAFAALVADIDYPMEKWDAVAVDEYLNYSLDVLDLLNKVSFCLSHLGQARLSLAHGLSLFENLSSNSPSSSPSSGSKHLVPICPKNIGKDLKLHGLKGNEENPGSGKKSVIREALLVMKSTGILLLGFMISGLCSDGNLYFGIRNSTNQSADLLVTSLDSFLSKGISDNGYMVKEVREVNAAAAGIAAARICHGSNEAKADAAIELSTKLELLENLLTNLGKQKDNLFSGVLVARNKLLDTIRHRQKN